MRVYYIAPRYEAKRGARYLQDQARIGTTTPAILPRSAHPISRANISGNALKVLYRLRERGYQGFLVGGGVRDLMLGREPKDFGDYARETAATGVWDVAAVAGPR